MDAAELNKNIKVDLPIHADAADALEAMKRGISYKDRSKWMAVAAENNKKEYGFFKSILFFIVYIINQILLFIKNIFYFSS